MYQNDNPLFFVRFRAAVQVVSGSASQVFVEVLQGGSIGTIAHFKKSIPNANPFVFVYYFQKLFYPVTVQIFLVTREAVFPDYRGECRAAYIQE